MALKRRRVRQLPGLLLQSAYALPQPSDPGLEFTFFDQAFGIAVNQPRQTLPQFTQLRLDGGPIRAAGARVGLQTATVLGR
jgi:hypothetical protein